MTSSKILNTFENEWKLVFNTIVCVLAPAKDEQKAADPEEEEAEESEEDCEEEKK